MSDAAAPLTLQLPGGLIGRGDVVRLAREVEYVDSQLESQKVKARSTDKKVSYHMPSMSQTLNDFVELNNLDLADDKLRPTIKRELMRLKDRAPVMHFTFPAAADQESVSKLVEWVRTNIHPQALISVGLQPSLVGGVYIRTPNKVFDFSLRHSLDGKRDILARTLGEYL